MVQIKTESGWQGSQEYIGYLSVLWNKNLSYSEKINDTTNVNSTLKALSDFYYSLYSFRSAMIFFIETSPESDKKIRDSLTSIKVLTGNKEILQCALDWDQVYALRDILLEIQDELFRVAGKSRLLVGITTKKQYETLGEELDEENA
jgi:hypothetical protein